jgi:hypothetical protein
MKFHTIPTSMRNAFDHIKVDLKKAHKSDNKVTDVIIAALRSKIGMVQRQDWNAHLTFKTAKELTAKGILV